MTDELKSRTVETYTSTADHFDDPALSFWDRFGAATVGRLDLRPGQVVLDVCCGTGASALHAARAVGPTGHVLAVDLSEPALALGQAKAEHQGLTNIEFRVDDMERLGLAPETFDAVVCVFGIFFVDDMAGAVRELWRLVRPGGRLAVTIWGPRFFEPAVSAFWDSVATERPDLVRGFHPWTRVTDPDALEEVLREGAVEAAAVVAEGGRHQVATPDDWWTMVLGTGYRSTVERLGPDAAERVRVANLTWVREHGVTSVETNVVYAVATKPA